MDVEPGTNGGEAANDYGAEQIRALKGIEHIRERPSMYIGDTTLAQSLWMIARGRQLRVPAARTPF